MHEAKRLYDAAQQCMSSLGGNNAGRLVLSLFFKAVLGIQRIFHFETIDDPGFALLTAGKKVISRSRLGQLIRKVAMRSVTRFMRETAVRLTQAAFHCFSIDEHAVARFTRKFRIPKGFHTIRNKKMKVEKLTYAFDLLGRKFVSLVVSVGDATLPTLVKKLLPTLRRKARGAPIRMVLDAGAAHKHDELLKVALHENQVTLVRTPRRKAYREQWKQLPSDAWTELHEPGPYKNAPPKRIEIAETTTTIKSKKDSTCHDVRTIVVRESTKRGKLRWHALWIFGDDETSPYDLVREFRTRQRHEQAYRVMLHDIHVDTAPSGYNKQSSDPGRPGFKQNALTLFGWIAALATNALLEFTESLPRRFYRAHPRTLRRWFFCTPAELYLGKDALIVLLRPKRLISIWQALVERANRRNTRIPWLDNRRLILSIDPKGQANNRKFQLIQ